MYVKSAKLTFRIPHAASLKDKRSICRSLLDKVRRKFNVSIAEVDCQDVHQMLVLGISLVSGDAAHSENCLNEIIRYMEDFTLAQAELIEVEIW
jgi:hypothetical protein